MTLRKLLMTSGLMLLVGGTPCWAQQMLPANVEAGQLYDAMAQTTGEFDTMNLNYIHSLGMQQKAWNDPMSHLGEGQLKPGYSRYVWAPDTVLPIRLREGMMTLINLPTWELIERVHLGSPESFAGEIPAPNSLLLYADPSFIGADSNMVIFGRSGNRYVFYLRSETYNTDKITQSVVDILVPKKYTPKSAGGTLKSFSGASVMAADSSLNVNNNLNSLGAKVNPETGKAEGQDWLQSIPVDPEKFRFDVEMFIPNPKDVDIAPERVWRDDIFTYIDLGPKALTMTQRPIVNLLVQETEVPVGFRTRGKNSRLIVVEAVGDMVLRNGKKLICLKLRRDPAMGLDQVEYANPDNSMYSISASGAGTNPYALGGMTGGAMPLMMGNQGMMMPMVQGQMTTGNAIPQAVMNSPEANSGILDVVKQITTDKTGGSANAVDVETISVELGAHTDIVTLEKMWDALLNRYGDLLKGYEPYYSVDATADGDVRELFRLRIGPFKDVNSGDALCQKLAKKGVSCSVVRVQ